MRRPARGREPELLRERYYLPDELLKVGAPVQILAAGGWPYEAIIVSLGPKRVRVEWQTRVGGHRERVFDRRDIFRPGALQSLRAERAAAPGAAAQEVP